MNKKYLPIVVLGLVVVLGAILLIKPKPKSVFSQFDLDLNCNLHDKPTAFTEICKDYKDAPLLQQNCVDTLDPSLEERCQAYFCAQRVNAGHPCE